MNPSRRKLLVATGSVAIAALGFEGARRIWREIAAGVPPASTVEDRHLDIIATLADALLPETDTPGALDVGVPAWVAHLLSVSFEPADRQFLLEGLDAIDARARARAGRGVAELRQHEVERLIESLDGGGRLEEFADRAVGVVLRHVETSGVVGGVLTRFGLERRVYREFKALIVHGYFTSEPVQHELAKVHGHG